MGAGCWRREDRRRSGGGLLTEEEKDLGKEGTEIPFPPVEALIPHRGPARLLERIVSGEGDELVAVAVVPVDHPLVVEESAPSTLALEIAAQAAAALAALEGGGERPRQGYLVGARNAMFERPWIAAGEELRVTVTPAGSAPPLAVHDFTVHAGEALVASGTISTYSL